MLGRLLGLAAAGAFVACAPELQTVPATQVVARLEAAPNVLSALKSLRVRTSAESEGHWTVKNDRTFSTSDLKGWPVDLVFKPSTEAAAAEYFELVVDALDAQGRSLVQARALSAFDLRKARVLNLSLSACGGRALGTLCEQAADCHGPDCLSCVMDSCDKTPITVPKSLPELQPVSMENGATIDDEAAGQDGGRGGDAGQANSHRDAEMPPPARTDAGKSEPAVRDDAGKPPIDAPNVGTPDAAVPPTVMAMPDSGRPPMSTPDAGPVVVVPVPTGPQPKLPTPSGACPDFVTGTATIGGLPGVALQVGPKQNKTGALVFYWHGQGSSSAEVNSMIAADARSEILDQGGIIVSFGGSTKVGADCSGTAVWSQGDFEIADLIASCAVSNHGIDPRRIYTTGCSGGALQAGCMASLRASYLAASVTNSGGLVFPQPIQSTTHMPAIMTMHGGTSDVVVVDFTETSKRLDMQMSKAGSYVMNCNHGGGHCGTTAALKVATWQFMKDHPFGETPEPYAGGIPGSFPAYCSKF